MTNNEHNFDDEWEREAAEEEADRLRKAEPGPSLDHDEFLLWRSPRRASANATPLDNPLWHWLVRTRWDAYKANNIYAGPSSFDAGPMWCFNRFGKSETTLQDGSVAHIGGEHEDHYDPDFFIYNDVIMVSPKGDVSIFGYPEDDFPPTDFHSATLVGESIFIIGGLGYPEQRVVGSTPVHKLSPNSMRIEGVTTCGEPPGWIYKHQASLSDDGLSIIINGGERWLGDDHATAENIDSWSLNTMTGEWRRLTAHNWQRWIMQRVDRQPSRLWDVRQAKWNHDHAHLGLESHWKFQDSPDFVALELLYRLDEQCLAPVQGAEFNVFYVVIDGVTVRFKEERFWIEAIVEGRLEEDRLRLLQRKTLELLERIEACACETPNISIGTGSYAAGHL